MKKSLMAMIVLTPMSWLTMGPMYNTHALAATTGAWVNITNGGAFTKPSAIAVDSAGDVFALNSTSTILERKTGSTTWKAIPTQPPASYGVAVDSSGDLFVTTPQNTVLELTSGSTTWTNITNGAAFNDPTGITVDKSGDVFVASSSNNQIFELPSGGTAWTNITDGAIFNAPTGIAVDKSGDVFVTSHNSNQVFELSSGSTTWTNVTNGATFNGPTDIAVDSAGNLFVTDYSSGTIYELQSGSTTWTNITNGAPIVYPYGIAVDSAGDLYVSNDTTTATGGTIEEYEMPPSAPTGLKNSSVTATGWTESWSAVVGATSYNVYINGTKVNTSPVTGTSYNVTGDQPSTVYKVTVTAVNAAGESAQSAGNSVNTLPPTGTLPPGQWVNITDGGSFSSPFGIAVDSAGDVFVTNAVPNNTTVYDLKSGSTTWNNITYGASFDGPRGIAVDSAGDLFVTNMNGDTIKELPSGSTSWSPYLVTGGSPYNYTAPEGIALDGSGNLYTWAAGNGVVIKNHIGSATITPLSSSFGQNLDGRVAVDSKGDVFLTLYNDNAVYELPSGSTTWVNITNGAGFIGPLGIRVDAAGNVFVVNNGNNTLYERPNGSTTWVNVTGGAGLSEPAGIAIDSAGDLFVTNLTGSIEEYVLAPSAPTGLSHSNVTTTGWTESWSAVSGATGYNVYVNGTKMNSSPVTTTSYNVTGETGGTTYNVTVTAVGAGGEGAASATDSVSTNDTVTFDSNGGSSVTSESVAYDSYATQPTNPTKAGYVFAGWYTDSTLQNAFSFGTPVTWNITLYAKWTAQEYAVNFNSNGGSQVQYQLVPYGSDATAPASPTKTGYVFAGWYTDSTFQNAFSFTTPITSSLTLYAKWTPQQYTVTFDSNGGSSVSSESVAYDGTATQPTSPTKTGAVFQGWYTDSTLQNQYSFGTLITGNITLYAKWTPQEYTVNFNSNGGSQVQYQLVPYGSDATAPTNPTRTGSVFAGWYTDSTLQNAFSFTTPITSSLTLYAKWTPAEYTVTFNSNGGSSVSSESVAYGGYATQPTNPTKTGETFAGWYTDSTLQTAFSFGTPIMGNITLYAKWTPQQYTVNFDSNGGSQVQYELVPYETDATQPAPPTKTGYVFAGWYTDSTLQTAFSFTTPITGSLTLYAKWTPQQYTVSFNSNGGSSVSSESVAYNGYATQPTNPTKTGAVFQGWYTDPTFQNQFSFSTAITGSITLYAKWTPQQYTVNFNSNGGSQVQYELVPYATDATAPPNPTKTGYVFAGWYTDSTLQTAFSFTTPITGNVTLYAKWTPQQYTVSFNSNGGTSVSSESVAYDSTATAPANPTKTGYEFQGWYTDSTLQNQFSFTTAITGNITLYAKWTPQQYAVNFDSNGGSQVQYELVPYGTDATAPTNPTKTGYVFAGWYTDATLQTAFSFTTPITGSLTLYAKWTPQQYTVNFNSNGGSSVSSESVAYDSTATAPTPPTKTGEVFQGWYTDSTLQNQFSFTTAITGNITLYAKWTPQQYTVSFNSNGGSQVQYELVPYETDATAPANPTKTGYVFAGWYTDSTLQTSFSFTTPITGNVTLYAKWTPQQYTVSFNSNGGSNVSSESVAYDSAATAPTTPTKTGEVFQGWYTDSTLQNQFSFSTVITGNITLYAKWTPQEYTVNFDSNGGSQVQYELVPYETDATAPASPTKTGYVFAGWYTDSTLQNAFSFTTPITGNVTLYAKWTPQQYTVSFNSNGGSSVSSESVAYDSTATAPTAPTKTGEVFQGWYTDSTLQNQFSFGTLITGNITLYAKWIPQQYTVNFNSNGGSQVQYELVPYETDATAPANPTKTGYVFAGWYTDASLQTAFSFTTPITGNVTLYAKWTPQQYTVSFNSNGGSSVSSESVAYDSTATAPTAPTKTGYVFQGWYTDSTLQNQFSFGTPITGNITLYAKWTPQEYTVSFNSNGGSGVSSESVAYDSTATAPASPTKTGEVFAGWYTDSSLQNQFSFSTAITGNITLYAKWTPQQYTVSFNSNGGSSVSSESVAYDSTATAPTAPTKTGEVFQGWYTDSTLQNQFSFSTVITGNITLYAKWTPQQYSVNFNSNGGSQVQYELVPYGTDATAPANPTKTGYVFAGWYTDSTLQTAFSFTTPITGSLTLYAKWTPQQYTVSFNSNGGSGVSSESVAYDSTATAPTAPTKTGYVFQGWYTDSTLQNQFSFSTAITGSITLYAKWTPQQYTVSFNSNGGSQVQYELVPYETDATAPANPTKTGYVFAGWYTDSTLQNAFSFTTPIAGSLTLYAKWTPQQYTVSFNSNGGSSVSSESVAYDSTATAPTAPTKTGYVFQGWYTDSTLQNQFSFGTLITGNITLYAKWTPQQYTVNFNSNGGSQVQYELVPYETDATAPANPMKTGYVFAGWYTDASLQTPFSFTTPITGSLTLYAKWTPQQYTVSFNSNGGSSVSSESVAYDSTATAPTAPTKTGYVFQGWYTDSTLQNQFSFTTAITGSITLYAKWTPQQYTVSFNSNGGSQVQYELVPYETDATAPANPTKTGYVFAGWYTDASLQTPFSFTTPITGSLTLYAKWTPQQYTVSFNSNGGSSVSSESVAYDSTATAPTAPTKTGYVFQGWYTDSTLQNQFSFSTVITGSITLYAKWTPQEYSVNFNSNGGSQVQYELVPYETDATAPASPTKTGYVFAGWYTDSTLQNAFSFTTPITGNVTLYAKWTPQQYTVSFNSNGGSSVSSESVAYDSTATAPTTPTKTGYVFAGWYTDSTLQSAFSFTTPITGSLTLYAKWTPQQYTVNFNSNGGSSVSSESVAYDSIATAPTPPTRTGEVFQGWYTDSTLQNAFSFTTPITGNVTLYAKWTPQQYTVSFNSNGGSSVSSESVAYDSTATAPTNPTKAGSVFAGWYTDASLQTAFSFTTPITGNLTLYAKWTLQPPTNLMHRFVGMSGWTETWSPVVGASKYVVYLNGREVATTSSAIYQFTGEAPNTTYSVTVAAMNVDGEMGTMSAIDYVHTLAQPYVAPLAVATAWAWGGLYGVPYNALQLYAYSGSSPYRWSVVNGKLPQGLVLSTGGVISGTPTGPNGTSTFTVQVTDANGQTARQTLSIEITGTPALSVATQSLPSLHVGENYSAQLDGVGVGPYTWTVVSGELPTGLTLDAAGRLNGIPTEAGTYTFNVELSNGSQQAAREFTLVVTGLPNDERLVLWNGHKWIVPAVVHNRTTYVPIWYVMQLLKPMGIDSTWNGTLWHMTTTAAVDLANISPGSGTSAIFMNGTLVQRLTHLVAVDPWSHKPTTYMPIWDVMEVLKRLGLQSTWNGTTWTVTN
ncbi:InlB B-repeat-containing protein [Alicyclobacillus sp. ALC3]|uniref:InlB B-repeat-containing protein n=1 Tax=Alicyclobacillus sp. ALC3 TaxID=2796143 RepID=UPI002378DEB2|nr:InlB B-repeat-containing protein [Alicyclobacillus sp. ALC3]WDL95644.1 InlB B-repeat-containing protein [Alicyclobacillus sp. ALC3]